MAGERVNAKQKFLSVLLICVAITLMASMLVLRVPPVHHFAMDILENMDLRQLTANRHGKPTQKSRDSTDPASTAESRVTTESTIDRQPKVANDNYDENILTNSSPLQIARGEYQNETVQVGETEGMQNNSAEEENWEDMMLRRFISRKTFLKHQCESYGGDLPSMVKMVLSNSFYFSRPYKFLACISAKGGASTWKTHLLHMNGYNKNIESPHLIFLEKKITALNLIGRSGLFKKMYEEEGVTRVMSVRHPFARLVSAYTDKYKNGEPVGRSNRFLKGPLKLMGKSSSSGTKVSVPFWAFLRYVIVEKNQGLENVNRHWRPYSSGCRPCHVPYDYILQLETFEDDLRYVVLKLGIKEIDVTTRNNKSSKKDRLTYLDYFKDVPDDVIRDIYSLYKEDFYLFGYEVPQFVKDVISSTSTKDD